MSLQKRLTYHLSSSSKKSESSLHKRRNLRNWEKGMELLTWDGCEVMTPILSTNQSYCASFSKNVVTLFLSFKRLITARNLTDRRSSLQTSQKEHSDRIPFTITFHPHNHSVKSIILKNFKLLQNDPETGTIFSQPPLISFKRDKNIGNFLVRSSFQTNNQPGTFLKVQNLSFHSQRQQNIGTQEIH